MKGLKISRHPRVDQIDLSADDWELFTYNMDCTPAVLALNSTFKKAVNGNFTKSQARKIMNDVQSQYSAYGAYDSEPTHLLEDMLDEVFGKEEYEN